MTFSERKMIFRSSMKIRLMTYMHIRIRSFFISIEFEYIRMWLSFKKWCVVFAYALIHDSWIAMISNFLTVESRRNDVITIFLNLCTLYCRIDSFLLMLVARELFEEEEKFMIAKCLFRRRFLEVDLEVCRYHVSVWFLWLLMSKSVCRLWERDKRADDWMFSLRARRWRMILLSDWWRDRTNKRFWLADELHDVRVRKISAEWS